MAYSDSTQQYQSKLTSYTRTGIKEIIPGTKDEGIARYRTMIYNIVNDSLSTAYPLAKKLLTEDEWGTTVHDFFSSHACQSPFLWKMPFEFYEYAKEHTVQLQDKYPFLIDLLLFEWVEIEVYMMEDLEVAFTKEGSIKSDALVLNPACIVQYFQYPVYNKKASEIIPTDFGHYFLLTHRNPETNLVSFLEVAPMLFRLIELLDGNAMTIAELTNQFSAQTNIEITAEITKNIEAFFEKCLVKGILLGFNT